MSLLIDAVLSGSICGEAYTCIATDIQLCLYVLLSNDAQCLYKRTKYQSGRETAGQQKERMGCLVSHTIHKIPPYPVLV